MGFLHKHEACSMLPTDCVQATVGRQPGWQPSPRKSLLCPEQSVPTAPVPKGRWETQFLKISFLQWDFYSLLQNWDVTPACCFLAFLVCFFYCVSTLFPLRDTTLLLCNTPVIRNLIQQVQNGSLSPYFNLLFLYVKPVSTRQAITSLWCSC